MVNETYNGWSNYETWNVALWLQNDFEFYSIASHCADYRSFLFFFGADDGVSKATPDGVYFDDPRLSFEELDGMIQELAE